MEARGWKDWERTNGSGGSRYSDFDDDDFFGSPSFWKDAARRVLTHRTKLGGEVNEPRTGFDMREEEDAREDEEDDETCLKRDAEGLCVVRTAPRCCRYGYCFGIEFDSAIVPSSSCLYLISGPCTFNPSPVFFRFIIHTTH